MNKKLLLTLSTIALSTNLLASGMHGDGHSEDKKMNDMHNMKDESMHKTHKPMHKDDMHEKMMANSDEVKTMPSDGQMLMSSPESLMVHFPAKVTLTAIQIMDDANNLLDVNFELSSEPVEMFEQALPTLDAGTYTVKYFYMNSDSEMSIEDFWFMVH